MIIVTFNPKDKLSLSNLQWTFYGFYQSMFASERTSPCCNIVTVKKLVIVGNAFAKKLIFFYYFFRLPIYIYIYHDANKRRKSIRIYSS